MGVVEAERGKIFGASATEGGFVPAHDHRIAVPLSSSKATPQKPPIDWPKPGPWDTPHVHRRG